MSLDLDPSVIWRDFTTDGIPASGAHDPRKVEIRQSLSALRQAVIALLADADPGLTLPNLLIRASDVGAGTPNAIQATTDLPLPAGDATALVALNIFEANTGSPVTVSFNGGAVLTVKTNSGNDVAAGGLTAGMTVAGFVSGSTFRLLSDQASAAILAAIEVLNEEAGQFRNQAEEFRNQAEQFAIDSDSSTRVLKAGDTMTGSLVFGADGLGLEFSDGASIRAIESALAYDGKTVEGAHLFRDNAGSELAQINRTQLSYRQYDLTKAVQFETIALAQTYTPFVAPEFIITLYRDSNKVRGSGATYQKVGSEPSHAGKFSITTVSASTQWYELFAPDDVVHAEQFGARRNNSTDDGPAFSAAATFLNSKSGGTVQGLAGTYRIGTSIQAQSNVWFNGAAGRRSILQAPSAGISGSFFFSGVSKSYVGVSFFRMVGDRGTATVDQNANAVNFGQCSHVWVTDNELTNIRGTGVFVSGLFGVTSQFTYILRNVITNTYWAICAFKGVSDVYIQHNTISVTQSNGILVDDATDGDNPSNVDVATKPSACARVHVCNNNLTDTCAIEFGAAINFANVLAGTISGNYIKKVGSSVGGWSINLSSGQNGWGLTQLVSVVGNLIWEIYGNGMNLQGAAGCSITANVFINIDASGGGGASMVYLQVNTSGNQDATFGNTIGENTFLGNTALAQVGVNIQAGVTDTYVGMNNNRQITTVVNNLGGTTNKRVSYVNA